MGQGHSYLKKFTVKDENDRIYYAASSMQGLCSYMEDARQTVIDLDHTGSTAFFGVYDGHGGANVAQYCANRFHTELLKDGHYQNNLDTAVGQVFFRMDEQLREHAEWRELANPRRFRFNLLCCLRDASSGVQLIIFPESRESLTLKEAQPAWLSSEETRSLLEMLVILAAYSQGIVRCAGQTRVQWGSYRVNGLLAMSRSIGDFYLKPQRLPATEQMVTCNPDVRTADITDDTEFLLIASDGIWDILSSQGAVDFVHQKLESGTTDLRTICEALLTRCFRSRDNSTVILVQFKPAARIPLPVPPLPEANIPHAPAVDQSAINPDAGAASDSEIKEDELPLSTMASDSEIKEDELPLSTMASSSQL